MTEKIVKLVVFVPEEHADDVRQAMGDAGAGVFGAYSHCFFSTKGTSRFIPQKGSNPFEGNVGEESSIKEERIETVCTQENLRGVIAAIKKVHPYEEVPVDIYPLLAEDKL